MVVADEDVAKLWPTAPAFTWIYDITQEQMPIPISTFQVPGLDPDGSPQPAMTGCHQPSERFAARSCPSPGSPRACGSSTSPIPSRPNEVGYYVPDRRPGADRPRPTTSPSTAAA